MPVRLIDPADIPPARLRVLWRPHLPPISAAAQSRIDLLWTRYQRQAQPAGKTLFNGPITCLLAARWEGSHIVLELAPADYKQFLVTVLRDRPWFLKHAPAALRRAVGNSALLTSGDSAFLGLRSDRVSAYPRRLHLIGGVLDQLHTPRLPPTARGIITHLRRELAEEAAIRPQDLRPAPRLLAIIRDEFLGQPELIWQWETRTSLAAIAQRLDPQEHTGFAIIHKKSVPPKTWRRMTPVARAAWQRWSRA